VAFGWNETHLEESYFNITGLGNSFDETVEIYFEDDFGNIMQQNVNVFMCESILRGQETI